jgi:hypothetical protein
MKLVKGLSVLSAAILLAACGGDSKDDDKNSLIVPETYTFESKVEAGASSVSHSGQATRHILINELKKVIASTELQGATAVDASTMLNSVYASGTKDADTSLVKVDVYSGNSGVTDVNVSIDTPQAILEQDDFSKVSDDKNLQGKMAGKDNPLTAGEFIGWDVVTVPGDDSVKGEGVNTAPEVLMQQWLAQIAVLAGDSDKKDSYVTAEGLDLQQLVQKFALGAVTYSQAAEDYLKADKGLLKQNSAGDKDGAKPYTSLEHQWDEGFGYFGAAHDYNLYTDVQNADQQDNDTNLDGYIDLYSEYSFGNSVNAAKRDKGSASFVATDYSRNAMNAFLTGRAIIQANFGTDPVEGQGYHVALVDQATIALNNWEKAIAATVVHYINDVVADYDKFLTEDFNHTGLAKHWSEMKGFALGLQFSPIAIISMDDLKSVHAAFGEAPELSSQTAVDAYVVKLLAARDTLQAAYGFNADNVANW